MSKPAHPPDPLPPALRAKINRIAIALAQAAARADHIRTESQTDHP